MGDFIEPGTHRSTNIKVKYDLRVRGSGTRGGGATWANSENVSSLSCCTFTVVGDKLNACND